MKKLLCIILFLLLAVSVNAATYYVKTGGNDGADGLSDGNAWATIGKVNGVNFADGDNIYFNKGDTFSDDLLDLAAVTTPAGEKTITIGSYGTGALPWIGGNSHMALRLRTEDTADFDELNIVVENIKIDGMEHTENLYKILIKGLHDVTIDNVTGDGSVGWSSQTRGGIWVEATTGDVVISNNTLIYWGGEDDLWATPEIPTGTGVDKHCASIRLITSGTLTINDNDFKNCEADVIQFEGVTVTSSVYDNTFANGGENSLDLKGVQNMSVYRNNMYRDATFVGVGGSNAPGWVHWETPIFQILPFSTYESHTNTIYNNKIGPCDGDGIRIAISSGSQEDNKNSTFYNNRITDVHHAIMFITTHSPEDQIYGHEFYNNLIDNLKSGGKFIYEEADSTTGNKIYNNTWYTDNACGYSYNDVEADNNCIRLVESHSEYQNNIFSANDGTNEILEVDSGGTDASFNNNLFYDADAGDDTIIDWNGTTYTETEADETAWNAARGGGGVFDNPDFEDSSSDEFFLLPGSPAINSGATLAATYDDGWDPDSSLPTNTVDTLDQDGYGTGWEIGVYVVTQIYNAYFADDGTDNIVDSWDTTECTESDPCDTLAEAQKVIDDLNSDDVVTLYFDKGDTWSADTEAVDTVNDYGIVVPVDGPTVNIDAYGSGNKPIFDGGVSDFSTTNEHDATNGPYRWNCMLRIHKDDTTVKNLRFQNVYGRAIRFATNTTWADNVTIESCEFVNIGTKAVDTGALFTQNTTVTKCLIHTSGLLSMNQKDGYSGAGWSNMLGFNTGTTARNPSGNEISYNVIYDIFGEGIAAHGATIEYNVIGDTASNAIFIQPHDDNMQDTIVRYNFIIHSSSATYYNISYGGGAGSRGIAIGDDRAAGENGNADIEVYGNVIINKNVGIHFNNPYDQMGSVKIYNNTFVDNRASNIYLKNCNGVASGFIYNNASILYDRAEKTTSCWDDSGGTCHVSDEDSPANWTIDTNAYWKTGGGPSVDTDWDTNYVITNPLLEGEEQGSPIDWDGQTGATYFSDIDFDMVYPRITGSLVGAGKTLSGYEDTFLTLGTDFAVLPDTQTFETSEQTDLVAYDIGAAIRALSYNFVPSDGSSNILGSVVITWTNQTDSASGNGYLTAGACPAGTPTQVITDSLVAQYDPDPDLTAGQTYCFTYDPENSLGQVEAGRDIQFSILPGGGGTSVLGGGASIGGGAVVK